MAGLWMEEEISRYLHHFPAGHHHLHTGLGKEQACRCVHLTQVLGLEAQVMGWNDNE